MVDMGPLTFYVSLKVIHDWTKKTIKLSQPGYDEKLLNQHGMLKAITTKTPIRKTFLLPYDKLVSSNEKQNMQLR